MLFLILDKHGVCLGHLGFANAINDQLEMEVDNVVRGVKNTQPGIMSSAMKALLKWAEETIWPGSIFLRVLSENQHAIDFYHKLGFKDDRLLPLRCHKRSDGTYYLPVNEGDQATPDKYFLRMVYAPVYKPDILNVILTAGPSISAREVSYASDAARSGWNAHWSEYINQFESKFAQYAGTKYAISTSSCTGALHISLAAMGIGPGDEVIVPDVTWVATAAAVVYVGATPVFADIEPDSWCLDPLSFEKAITPKTKAVIPVHLYGHPARMDKIVEIARKHGLYILEDAAPAIGAEFMGRKVGTFGDLATFSFQGAKLMVSGEGGMIVTNNDDLYARAHALWDQGRKPGTFWINQIGLKYKISNVQAAIGLGQLERVDELIEAKRRLFAWYQEGLRDVPELPLNVECSWARSIYWMPSILVDDSLGLNRDEMREQLRKRGIDTRPLFPQISQYPMWVEQNNPVARKVGAQGINLPSGVCLKRPQIDYICRSIKEILSQRG
jgi:perosamine synthetase